ncbi:hypothetical protein [Dyella silvae]|uniref:hypothetical protein n=1 Tax=Dyella silvae TaxID=2994424 RepID=UPI002264B59A|nr:hypothetical protein [Dyella silvae]
MFNRKFRRALFGFSILTLACSSAMAGSLPVDPAGKASLDRLLLDSKLPFATNDLPPIVRIVSPLADSSVAGGTSTHKVGSFNGTNMLVNLEVVTRDSVPLVVREATEAPPVFGIRHVPDLLAGQANPDAPGLYVFFDQPLIMPDGTVMPAFTNFASAFNVAGSDDTPGRGRTTWLGWHVLESLPAGTNEVTLTVAFVDSAGRVATDQVRLPVNKAASSGQALTPAPESFPGSASTVDDGQGPEVSMIAPRVPTSIAIGPTDSSLNPTNGSLFFIQVSSLDRNHHGIAVSENGLTSAGQPLNATIPAGLIFDPSQIPSQGHAGGPNRNFPGLTVTFDVPLRQPNGNVVPAGTNLAGLFDVAGSEVDASGAVRTTADWVVGGSLVLPQGKKNVTVTSSVTDNKGHTGTTKNIFSISSVVSGQSLTLDPPAGG